MSSTIVVTGSYTSCLKQYFCTTVYFVSSVTVLGVVSTSRATHYYKYPTFLWRDPLLLCTFTFFQVTQTRSSLSLALSTLGPTLAIDTRIASHCSSYPAPG